MTNLNKILQHSRAAVSTRQKHISANILMLSSSSAAQKHQRTRQKCNTNMVIAQPVEYYVNSIRCSITDWNQNLRCQSDGKLLLEFV